MVDAGDPGRTVATAVVVMLAAALGVSWAVTVTDRGFVEGLPAAFSLYMAAVLAIALHRNGLRSATFHVAFFLGVAGWALDSYLLRDGGALAAIVCLVAAAIVLIRGRRLLADRGGHLPFAS